MSFVNPSSDMFSDLVSSGLVTSFATSMKNQNLNFLSDYYFRCFQLNALKKFYCNTSVPSCLVDYQFLHEISQSVSYHSLSWLLGHIFYYCKYRRDLFSISLSEIKLI